MRAFAAASSGVETMPFRRQLPEMTVQTGTSSGSSARDFPCRGNRGVKILFHTIGLRNAVERVRETVSSARALRYDAMAPS
jgi:hypothetical protein